MHTLKILSLILLLASCTTTPAERAAREEREVEQMIQVYGPACDKLGYQQESDAWRSCVLQLAAQDDFKRYSQYNSMPRHTHCFAHKGFYNCTTF
jgi:hypothetical protein